MKKTVSITSKVIILDSLDSPMMSESSSSKVPCRVSWCSPLLDAVQVRNTMCLCLGSAVSNDEDQVTMEGKNTKDG